MSTVAEGSGPVVETPVAVAPALTPEKKASGKRVAARHGAARSGVPPLVMFAGYVVGAVGAGAAWVFLVLAAIDFGVVAVRGQGHAWAFTAAATLGGVVCALLVMVLMTRALKVVGVVRDYKPRRAAAKRKATSD